jgi:hypothetical protein
MNLAKGEQKLIECGAIVRSEEIASISQSWRVSCAR